MSKTQTLTIEVTEGEYSELLAKLANQLDLYGGAATLDFQNVFMKIANANLPTAIETTLVKHFKKELA